MAALRTLILLAIAGCSCSWSSDCSYFGLMNHLNLATSNKALEIVRPVKNWTTTTLVQLGMILDAILEVIVGHRYVCCEEDAGIDEKLQTVTNHIWIKMYWINEFLTWNSSEFCGMDILTIPSSMIWIPDIIIQEDASDNKGSQDNALVSVLSSGLVRVNTRLQLTYACKFDLYRFPFDTQTCNITFSSVNYDENLVKLGELPNDTILTEVSDQKMLTDGEWKLVNIESISSTSFTLKSKLVYRISLQRKPFLYIINLILPLLFLLVLDLASFFISETGGEKLGFKMTILLSIFVLLLVLKDILPSTEDTLPLIAIYCVLVFTLVWISVLMTMLISFLKNLACSVGEEAHSSKIFKVKTQQEESAGAAGSAKPEGSNPPMDPPGGRGLLKLILDKQKPAQNNPERQIKDVGKFSCSRLRLVKIFDSVLFVLYFTTVVFSQIFIFTLWIFPVI